jgi:hypothetical protein
MRDQPVPEAETIDYWTRLEETRITEKKIIEKLRISDPYQRKDQMESEGYSSILLRVHTSTSSKI